MKAVGKLMLFAGMLLLAVSCLDDPDMIKWRDANADFMASLKDSADVYPLEKNDSLLCAQRGETYVEGPSTGIYYKVLKEGKGEIAVIGQAVTFNYTGWLYDGTEFTDGTVSPTIGSGTIDGLVEVLQRMPIGSTWQVYIPYYLGYGSADYSYTDPEIPAYSALIFEIELKGFYND